MSARRNKKAARSGGELLQLVASRLRPPIGIVLGAPGEVVELASALPEGGMTCFQMDLFQAARIADAFRTRNRVAHVETRADLWDLPAPMETLIYPIAQGGERALKLDMIEQAFHALAPGGTLVVLSPYDKENVISPALKKIFGSVHVPAGSDNALFWCRRDGDRPRRRHEITYHVRVDEQTSYAFVSRPGVFGYGFYDHGARAMMEVAELAPGQDVLDLGCGVGTNGILAARRVAPDGRVTFVDSNVRASAVTQLNADALGIANHRLLASHTLTELADASFDVVLANPPYYAQGAIVRLFVERSRALLRPGGVLYLVSKQVDVAWPIMQEHFAEPEMFENRGYIVFQARIP